MASMCDRTKNYYREYNELYKIDLHCLDLDTSNFVFLINFF